MCFRWLLKAVGLSEKRVVYSASAGYFARLLTPFVLAFAIAIPALYIALFHVEVEPILGALVTGGAIIAAAFMLGWVGEAAEVDLSGGLTVGLLAVITILPEYIVSVYFAYAAGSDPSMAAYASANLTGANRLLLGFGWPAIALVGYLAMRGIRNRKAKQSGTDAAHEPYGILVNKESRIDLGFLLIASVIALIIPFTREISLWVGLLLVALFLWYLWRAGLEDSEEPELTGTAAYVGFLPKWGRRTFIIVVVLLAAAVILACAEPFAHNLILTGKKLGLDDYLLVQWLAPIASEAPEFALAMVFASKGKPGLGLGVLISSKVNQWTALTGSLPIAYAFGGGHGSLFMDARQVEEFSLTIAQTLLGVALLLSLRLGVRASILLFVLFASTFVFTTPDARWIVTGVYVVIALVMFVVRIRYVWPTLKAPFSRDLVGRFAKSK